MANIHIVVGSVMGTAYGVAFSVKAVLEGLGHSVNIIEHFKPDNFPGGNLSHCLSDGSLVLVCTSNTGMGDLPESIASFYTHLINDNPPIYGLRYGLINLGDSSYPNFGEAGIRLDETLSDLGARRIGDLLTLDAIEAVNPEDSAASWIAEWQKLL